MKNGVFHGGKAEGWFWRYGKEKKGGAGFFPTKESAERSYIDRLMETRYAELLAGRLFERQRKIVFGPDA